MAGRKEKDISIRIGTQVFRNPVFLASGTCGYGEELSGLLDLSRLGGIVTKTITLSPRPGNPPPRIQELETGLLNSIGLENVGVEAYLREKLPALASLDAAVLVSIAADAMEEFESLAVALSKARGFKGVELNLSCPNVERGVLDHGSTPEFVRDVTAKVKAVLPSVPLLVKLTPNVASIGEVAMAAQEGGADGITAINTVLGADFDLATGKPVFSRVRAGYSGPGILPIALGKVWEVASTVEIPVVGVGGISSVEDARKFFLAGATAVQVGTALFTDPSLPERIVQALEEHPEWAVPGGRL